MRTLLIAAILMTTPTAANASWWLPRWFTPSGAEHSYPQANCDKGWFKRRGDCWRRIY